MVRVFTEASGQNLHNREYIDFAANFSRQECPSSSTRPPSHDYINHQSVSIQRRSCRSL